MLHWSSPSWLPADSEGECHCSTRPIKQGIFKCHLIHVLPFGTAGSVVQINRVTTDFQQITAHILRLPITSSTCPWSCQGSQWRAPFGDVFVFPTVDADIEYDGLQNSEGPPAGSDEASTSSSSEDSGAKSTTHVKPSTLFDSCTQEVIPETQQDQMLLPCKEGVMTDVFGEARCGS